MEVVETEFEIFRISKPARLPFEGFDFVYETLDGTAGDAMLEVVNPTRTVNWSRLCSCDESNRPNGFSVEST